MANKTWWMGLGVIWLAGLLGGCPSKDRPEVGQTTAQGTLEQAEAGCERICEAEARCAASDKSREQCMRACAEQEAAPLLSRYRPEVAVALFECSSHALAQLRCDPAGGEAASIAAAECMREVAVEARCDGPSLSERMPVRCESNDPAACEACLSTTPLTDASEALFRCYSDQAQARAVECIEAFACHPDAAAFSHALALTLWVGEATYEGSDGICCGPDDACLRADDGVCDCDGGQAWDAADCQETAR